MRKRDEVTKKLRKRYEVTKKVRKALVTKLPSYEIVTPPIGMIYYDA
jgi:hypothetical protein